MDIQVLGPMAASTAGASIVPTAAKPRQILAMLALNANHVVSVAQLTEELWCGRPPRSAATTLQTYILQLRRKLRLSVNGASQCEATEILTTHGGYVLEVEPGTVDALEFERLAGAGYAAFTAGDVHSASTLLRSALLQWRGPALVDVPHGHELAIHVTRLEESRIAVLSRRIRADLRLSRYHELIGELSGLTMKFPTDEGLHAHLMAALHRDGRRPEALAVYQRLSATLVEELGLEPCGPLQRLHRAIVRDEPVDDSGAANCAVPMSDIGQLAG